MNNFWKTTKQINTEYYNPKFVKKCRNCKLFPCLKLPNYNDPACENYIMKRSIKNKCNFS